MARQDVLYVWVFSKDGQKHVASVLSSPNIALAARHVDNMDPSAHTILFRPARDPQEVDEIVAQLYAEDPERVGAEMMDPQNPTRAIFGRPQDTPLDEQNTLITKGRSTQNAAQIHLAAQQLKMGPQRKASDLLTADGALANPEMTLADALDADPDAAGTAQPDSDVGIPPAQQAERPPVSIGGESLTDADGPAV